MKEFNLELAKAGHPVQTRDGRPARIICYDRKDNEYPIVALINENEVPWFYRKDGTSSGNESYDLFMATTRKEGWVNIHQNLQSGNCNYWVSDVYNTKEEALFNKQSNYITTTIITWEE